jgi:hypothetical protein
MRRRTLARDLLGTVTVFAILVVITFILILGEHWLENFKAH